MRNLEFNLLEIMEDNSLALRFVDLDETDKRGKIQFHRAKYDPSSPDNAPELVQLVASQFSEESLGEGTHMVPTQIRLHATDRVHCGYYNAKVTVLDGEITERSILGKFIEMDCLCDLSEHPEKVQTAASLVFTEAVKADFIASLPRVEIETDGEPTISTETIPEETKKMVVGGVLTDVVIKEAEEVALTIPATQTFIQYKGELYPEGWNGDL